MPSIRIALGIATALLGAPCRGALAQQPAATGMIVGHVLGQDGAPFRDAEVWATAPAAPDVVVRRARTDGDGMFVLARLAIQRLNVFARAPSMTTVRVEASPTVNTPLAVDLRLWEARALRGRILDPDGKAIAGASLVASKDFAVFAYEPVEGTTDAEGRFELRGVPIGECVLRAIAPGFAFNGCVFDDVFDERVDLTLPQNDGLSLRIEVQGLPGPAAQATQIRLQAVALGGAYSMPRLIEQQRLAADGTCTVKGLPETQWLATLRHPEFQFQPSTLHVRTVKATEPVRIVATPAESVAMPAPSGVEKQADAPAVRGKVVDARGFAVSYAAVELQQGRPFAARGGLRWQSILRTTSRADGSFAFPEFPIYDCPNRILARGASAFGVSAEFRIVAGQAAEQNVATEAAARVEGRLLDPLGNAAAGISMCLREVVAGAPLRVTGESAPVSVMTDHQGRFVFVGLPPGSYRLTALYKRITHFADEPAFEVQSSATVRRELVMQ